MRAWSRVPAKARWAAAPRSASSITACRTSAAEVPYATAIASSTSDCFTPMRMSPSISLRRYFASSGVARRSSDSTSAARMAVVLAVAIAPNASETSESKRVPSPLIRCEVNRSKAAAPKSPCRRYAAVNSVSPAEVTASKALVKREPPAFSLRGSASGKGSPAR